MGTALLNSSVHIPAYAGLLSVKTRPSHLRCVIAGTRLGTYLNENRHAIDHTLHKAQFSIKSF